eukprot:351465-Chlamydomonas_euryale.AAC.2
MECRPHPVVAAPGACLQRRAPVAHALVRLRPHLELLGHVHDKNVRDAAPAERRGRVCKCLPARKRKFAEHGQLQRAANAGLLYRLPLGGSLHTFIVLPATLNACMRVWS